MIKLFICEYNKGNEHTVAAELARYALFDVYGIRAELKKGKNGKPFFKGCDAHISLSHSNGLCLAAISDGEIGADIEKIRGNSEHLLRIAGRYLTPDEVQYISVCPTQRFFEIWCKKESYIKYTGEGFSRPFSSFSVFDGDMSLTYFEIDGYGIGVCSKEKVTSKPVLACSVGTDKK